MTSKTGIDRLGERLKLYEISETELRELDQYRRSFAEGYEKVVRTIRETLDLAPTGRPAKSTWSIVEKLQRESIRLSQMQDIAGCRVVVAGIAEQEDAIERLKGLFDSVVVVDRRKRPSNGYRAVHLIVRLSGKPIEVQVRTALQHAWAEYSEKMADVVDPDIKYGGGNKTARDLLARASTLVKHLETEQSRLITAAKGTPEEELRHVASAQMHLKAEEADLRELLIKFTNDWQRGKG